MLTAIQHTDAPKRLATMTAAGFAAAVICLLVYAVSAFDFTKVAFLSIAIIFPFAIALAPQRRLLVMAGMLIAAPLNIDQTYFLHPSPGGADGLLLSVTDLFMLILLFITLSRSSRSNQRGDLRFYPAILLPSLALFVMSIISLLNARDLLWSSFDLLSMAKTLLFFWLLANNIRSRRDLDVVLVSMFIGIIMQTILAAIMTFRPETVELMASFKLGISKELLESKEYTNEFYRSGGSIGNANHLARYIGLILPLAFVTSFTERRRGMRAFSTLTMFIGSLGLISTFTRSAWIGLVLSLIIMLPLMIINRLVTLRILFRLGTVAIVGVIIVFLFRQPIEARLFGDDNGSGYTRITTSKVALAIINDYPLIGCGINNYGSMLPEYWLAEDVFTRDAAVHNNYLLYAAEIGLLGFAAYLWLLIAAGAQIFRAMKSRMPYYAAVAVGVMAAFGAYLVEALSDKSYKESYTLLLTFWALLAIVEAIIRLNESTDKGN